MNFGQKLQLEIIHLRAICLLSGMIYDHPLLFCYMHVSLISFKIYSSNFNDLSLHVVIKSVTMTNRIVMLYECWETIGKRRLKKCKHEKY